jgi:hypothetical protein
MKSTNRKPQVKTTNRGPQIDTTDDWFGVRQRLESGDQQRGAVAAGDGRPLPSSKSGRAVVPPIEPVRGAVKSGDGRALPWRRSGKAVVPRIDRSGKRSNPLPPGLDAHKVFAVLEKFRKSGLVAVECYRDEGWPWVRISYDGIVSPLEVLAVGAAIQSVLPPKGNVLFQMLRPESIYFIIDGIPLAQVDSDAELPATAYGVALDALKKAGWPAYRLPQLAAPQAQAAAADSRLKRAREMGPLVKKAARSAVRTLYGSPRTTVAA